MLPLHMPGRASAYAFLFCARPLCVGQASDRAGRCTWYGDMPGRRKCDARRAAIQLPWVAPMPIPVAMDISRMSRSTWCARGIGCRWGTLQHHGVGLVRRARRAARGAKESEVTSLHRVRPVYLAPRVWGVGVGGGVGGYTRTSQTSLSQ